MNDRMVSSNKVLGIVNDPTISATDAVKMIRQLLSNSSRPTLEDMTDEEREACQWMLADLKVADLTPGEQPACRWTHTDLKGGGSRVVILNHLEGGRRTRVVWPCGCTKPVAWEKITPRPDRAPMEWPDTEKPTPAPAVEVGDIIVSAADPRFKALPVGSVLLDRDGVTTTKWAEGRWTGFGHTPIPSQGDEFGPWTVHRIGLVADQ